MIVYRITKRNHASDIQGTGSALFPGRWNKKENPVLYTGASKEIALLEIIVHIPPMMIPNLNILTLEIPDESITELKPSDLPANWTQYPAPTVLSEISENWVQKIETIALKVPSCIIHSSYNYILNCKHKDYNHVKVIDHREFFFDSRLIR